MNRLLTLYLLLTPLFGAEFNWDETKIFAHRGGIRRLVPASSVVSFTIGAQENTDYLELDIGASGDGELIVIHDITLDDMTDVVDHPEFADRKQTFNVLCMEPNEHTPNRADWYCNIEGFYSFNFTLAELKTLRLRSRYPFVDKNNPLNDRFEILTFGEFLQLVNNLSVALDRDIGITPEIKNAPFFRSLGLDLEWKYMELLYEYGFVEKVNGYYKTKYFSRNEDTEPWPLVIVQTDSPTTLNIIANLSNNDYSSDPIVENVPLQFGIYEEDVLDSVVVNWVNTVAGGLNIPWCYVDKFYDLLQSEDVTVRARFRLQDFVPGTYEYTDQYVRNHYLMGMHYRALYGLDSIFSDNVQDIKTIMWMLKEFSDPSSLIYTTAPELIDYDAVIEGLGVKVEGNEEKKDIGVLLGLLIAVIVLYVITVIVK